MERVNHPEMLFGELSRRRHERLDSCFGGGVPDAPALERRKVRGLAGACRYALKPPLGAATYYRSAKGSPFAPVRDLTKAEHFFLWRHPHGLYLPGAGDRGRRGSAGASPRTGASGSRKDDPVGRVGGRVVPGRPPRLAVTTVAPHGQPSSRPGDERSVGRWPR